MWVNGVLLAERLPDGTWTDYLYANGQRIAAVCNSGVRYFIADPLGITRMELSASGEIITKSEFAPFGLPLHSGSSLAETVPFTGGEQHDLETKLDNYKYRSYNPALGLWMSPDPSGERYANLQDPQTLNLYTYVVNNPLKFTDSLGLMHCVPYDGEDYLNKIGDADGNNSDPDGPEGGSGIRYDPCDNEGGGGGELNGGGDGDGNGDGNGDGDGDGDDGGESITPGTPNPPSQPCSVGYCNLQTYYQKSPFGNICASGKKANGSSATLYSLITCSGNYSACTNQKNTQPFRDACSAQGQTPMECKTLPNPWSGISYYCPCCDYNE
jgi:RHS repeat-associated protein